jgi:hypothetical protein
LNYPTTGHSFYLTGLRSGFWLGFSGSLDLLDRFEELALKFRPVSIVQPSLYIGSVSGTKPSYVSLPIWLFLFGVVTERIETGVDTLFVPH